MPNYTVAASEVGVHEIPLLANTEVVVQFAVSVGDIEIENIAGTSRVYFTTNGSPPTVRGRNCRALAAALNAVEVTRDPGEAGGAVRMIAEHDTTVSVTRS